MKNAIQFSAFVSKVQTLADRSLQIKLETPELPISQMSQLFQLRDSCMVAIAPYDVPIDKFDPATMDMDKDRSPSKRQRNLIYVLWTKDNNGFDDFDQFYVMYMNKLNNVIKDKISKYE